MAMASVRFNQIQPGLEPKEMAARYQATVDMAEYADKHGVGYHILSYTAPGIQDIADPAEALQRIQLPNRSSPRVPIPLLALRKESAAIRHVRNGVPMPLQCHSMLR